MKRRGLVLFFLFLGASVYAQGSPSLSLTLTPGGSLPLGPNSSYFSFGAGADITASIAGVLPLVSPRIAIGYDYIPLATLGYVNLFHAGAGLGLPLSVTPVFRVEPYLMGGYTFGIISDGAGQGGVPFVKGGSGFSFALSDTFRLGADLSYRWDIGAWSGVDASASVGVTFPLAPPTADHRAIKGVEFLSAKLLPVFPAQFKLYDERPFGSFALHNLEYSPLSDVTVDFYVNTYMDNPTRLLTLPVMDASANIDVPIKALFSEQVLKITEATKVSGRITVNFVLDGQPYTKEFTVTVRLNNRNSITWDDTRKAAAFVTPNDPLVLALGKSAISVTADVQSGQVDKWLIAAMALHEALRLKGIRYSTNPNSPFSDVLHNASVIDTVLFPSEELVYGAGNCSDLTVLYCSLLESLGAHTAFITTPGHIYAAVQLDVSPDKIDRIFAQPQDLIIQDGKTWLPVEVTMCGDSFVAAWQTGAQEWREFYGQGKTEFLPVETSWQTYEPVGQIPVPANTVRLPDVSAMASAFKTSFKQFVDKELAIRVSAIEHEIDARKDDPKPRNTLGVLYAQYGRIALAKAEFEAASKLADYAPAIINLANISFLERDYRSALDFYKKAAFFEPTSAVAMVGIARSEAGLEKFDDARAEYAKLQKANPDLASKFAYLGDQGATQSRAASQDEKAGLAVWAEEDK